MLKRYTKGDKDIVVSRINQVSDITIYVPKSDRCVDYLYDGLVLLCCNYMELISHIWHWCVPTFAGTFFFIFNYCAFGS